LPEANGSALSQEWEGWLRRLLVRLQQLVRQAPVGLVQETCDQIARTGPGDS